MAPMFCKWMMNEAKEYFAVIFTSRHFGEDLKEYVALSDRMVELASQQSGFLGIESARRSDDGVGITVSYWKDEESVRAWKGNAEHLIAQKLGREKWYESFSVRVAKVCREYHFKRKVEPDGGANSVPLRSTE